MRVALLKSLGLVTALGMVSAACGSPGGGKLAAVSHRRVAVVASTNVYGDLVEKIAGGRVSLASIISDPAQDPHSYEASPSTQLALSKAEIVIENGGGYDDFVYTMMKASHNTRATLLDAVRISGHTAPPDGDLNEHVWYDFPSVQKVIEALVGALSKADHAGASTFRGNADALERKLGGLEASEARIRATHQGAAVAITEPVPLYMIEACGLRNRTPDAFAEAVEEGTDVPVRVLQDTLALFSGRQVRLLAYNEQTAGPETQKLLQAASANGVAVVPVTETLPAGKDYVGWMTGNLAALQNALSK